MQTYRADRVVRILTGLVSLVYHGAWVVAAFVLIVGPGLKKFAPRLVVDPSFRVEVAVTLPGLGATLVPQWQAAPPGITLNRVTGDLALPESMMPAWWGPVGYAALVLLFGLVLLFLHHLRALFRRVREGAPFDAANVIRMRWLGVLLLVFQVYFAALDYWGSTMVTRVLASSRIPIGSALHINWFGVFIALVLVGLAEVFRRGAALEEEQSLVV
jgi:hypothetical protein